MWSLLLLLSIALAQSTAVSVAGEEGRWQRVLERVATGVVALRVDVTRGFDTESASSTVATGFVVDKEQGLILTNRHVVTPAPVVAEAVFLNHEEVPLKAVYRDPVHDFGLFRYDPAEVRYIDPEEIALRPDRARVGADIRIVGNDAGEKISILAGTLARLDREAPSYGRNRYNDFNTFYLQAASGTSGGSSGSPVLDISGVAIALNAGARRKAASSYFLPLDRIVRAVDLIRAGKPVTRGTIQATFRHEPYDELRRLGLQEETEARFRQTFAGSTGLLVVESAVPGGPAHRELRPGDVLLTVDGQPLQGFVPLEAVLDERVGQTVSLGVERGGKPMEIALDVQDLHAISPSAYLEFGDATLNELSYQMARNHQVPVGGPFIAANGYVFERAGVSSNSVITEIGGEPVADLGELEERLVRYADGQEVTVRYFNLGDPAQERLASIIVDRTWFRMQRCDLQDDGGTWACEASADPPERPLLKPSSTTFPPESNRVAAKVAHSLVTVHYDIPYRIEGVYGTRFRGTGLVVDAERGLVVTDRDTVPIALGDARISIAASVEIPARVLYLHPEHNIAVLQYDPALLGDTPIRSAVLDPRRLDEGDRVWLVGLSTGDEVAVRKTKVDRRIPLYVPLPSPPFFRDKNLEVLMLTDTTSTSGGVLVDRKGRVRATWASFVALNGDEPRSYFYGMPVELLLDVLPALRAGEDPRWRSLGMALSSLTIAEARKLGLDQEWAERLEAAATDGRRQVLAVSRLTAGTSAARQLEEGDLLLQAGGVPVTRFRQVELAAQQGGSLDLTVMRGGQVERLTIDTQVLDGQGTARVLVWGGTLLHEPHQALPAQRGILREGVYIAWYWYGGPAGRYEVRPTRRIVSVDGEPTPNLETFVEVVADKQDRDPVRLQTIDLDGRQAMITLVLDLKYWPTYELRRTEAQGWVRRSFD